MTHHTSIAGLLQRTFLLVLLLLLLLSSARADTPHSQSGRGQIEPLASIADLPNFSHALIFFDIDETIVIPNATSFIYGVQSTDDFVVFLETTLPPAAVHRYVQLMEDAYYRSPVRLVEGSLTFDTVYALPLAGNEIHGLTARSLAANTTATLLRNLRDLGIKFGELPAKLEYPNADGIIFAHDENKGDIMAQYWHTYRYPWSSLVLIDDTLRKCQEALEALRRYGLTDVARIFHYTATKEQITFRDMLYQFASLTANVYPAVSP